MIVNKNNRFILFCVSFWVILIETFLRNWIGKWFVTSNAQNFEKYGVKVRWFAKSSGRKGQNLMAEIPDGWRSCTYSLGNQIIQTGQYRLEKKEEKNWNPYSKQLGWFAVWNIWSFFTIFQSRLRAAGWFSSCWLYPPPEGGGTKNFMLTSVGRPGAWGRVS